MKKIYLGYFLFLLIFLSIQHKTFAQGSIPFGNSYVNISKKKTGGIIEKNDTLEIRNTYYFPTAYNPIYKVRFLSNLPANTQILTNDSLRIISNEGVTIFKYTYDSSDDAATYINTPPINDYNIRINMGSIVGAPSANSITDITGASTITPGTAKQKLNGTLITTAFRVIVTGNPGDTIILGASKFIFRRGGSGNPDTTVNSVQYKILIDSIKTLLCPNVKGVNIAAEMGGTFDSGTTQNRSNLTYPIPGYSYVPLTSSAQTNDGRYCIVNNLSPYAGTFQNPEIKPSCTSAYPAINSCTYRMFGGFWDIIGDHTGSNNAAGNAPAAPGTRGGYMLAVNASYAMSDAYRQQINTLCPNTTYEFSAWIRNICRKCGQDVNGVQTYKPGVLPNLTFVVDSIDRYSSGEIDTVGWQKKGFTFRTGPSQTSVTIAIRNNAPGGGGNDWVMDDIGIATCYPDLIMSPKDTATSCTGLRMYLSDTVKSIENTYVNYCWEKSADGTAWINTGTCGTKLPAFINGMWQYIVDTSFVNTAADSNTYYRLKVATTTANLSDSSCSINNSQKIYLKVYNVECKLLDAHNLVLSVELINGKSVLSWASSSEKNIKAYIIEKSIDGRNFTEAGLVTSERLNSISNYIFIDADKIEQQTFYRIKMQQDDNKIIYSGIAMVNNHPDFFTAASNPFNNVIKLHTTSPASGKLYAELFDSWGRLIAKNTFNINKGINYNSIPNLRKAAAGLYILRLQLNGKSAESKLVKTF